MKIKNYAARIILVFSVLQPFSAFSKVEVNPDGTVGSTSPHKSSEKGAEKYMGVTSKEPAKSFSSIGNDTHFLAVHLGTFVNDTAYQWGATPKLTNVGSFNAGLSYRFGEWTNSMDFLFRADFLSYNVPEGRAIKLSLLPMITFPDAASSFPLYFGVGAGLGIFLQQISGESSISLDYELVGGVRFFNVIDSTGFFLESGLKNHFLLLSDGQFNGVFVAAGALFTF